RLAVALSHPAWDVRRHAVMLLADLGGEEARAALEARASVEEDDLVGEALETALGGMGS
ncbi:MAG: HEAT repeat domain-containing protein, partial [Deltaproteobacteria bacterium]|nr:HEAT repeat domain-containing protein [Deltaproteobacteria bacterium]